MANYSDITINGLWKNNPALVQLLGLCPLLGVTNSVVNSIGLGLATIFVLVASNTCVSLIKTVTPDAIRLPTFVMIIAAAVTCTELLITVFNNYPQFLLAILPPGAFILTGLIIAAKNYIDGGIKRAQLAKLADEEKVSKRVRVTGTIS